MPVYLEDGVSRLFRNIENNLRRLNSIITQKIKSKEFTSDGKVNKRIAIT
jgi:hypothetical protein